MRHPLAVVRILQHSLDQLVVGRRRRVAHEGRHLFGRRRQPEQIRIQAADERATVGFGRRLQADLGEPLGHQHIDAILPGRNRRLDRRFIGPMLLILRPLRDPALEDLLLRAA